MVKHTQATHFNYSGQWKQNKIILSSPGNLENVFSKENSIED